MTKSINWEFARFIAVGVVNSLLGYMLYLLLLILLPYALAYTTAYIAGIFISYYLNSRFVFKEKLSLSKAIRYPVVYLVQYGLGIVFLFLLVELLHLDERFAPLLVVILTIPFTFLLSRFIIRGNRLRVVDSVA